MLILGIETSCDDTSLCLAKVDTAGKFSILAIETSNQDEVLEYWGGVVPEISARNHHAKIPVLLQKIFEQTQIKFEAIDLIGVTNRPGLIGPLLTGVNLAKSFAILFEKPIFAVHHLLAHLQAIHLTTPIAYPYLGVLVSGGNGLIVKVTGTNSWEILGRCLDDAPGEAFDKAGRMLGLGYPAGAKIDALAVKGNPFAYYFPIGLKNTKQCDMSFSGVKTSLRYFLEKNPVQPEVLSDICASYQHAIVAGIIEAIKKVPSSSTMPIVVGGGVACNSYLRQQLKLVFPNSFFVAKEYCTDNAAMIAHLTYLNSQYAQSYPDCLSFEVFSHP